MLKRIYLDQLFLLLQFHMVTDKGFPEPPQRAKGDDIHVMGDTAISFIGTLVGSAVGVPVLGAIMSASYKKILAPPLTKRTEEYLRTVYDKLLELENEMDGLKLKIYLRTIFLLLHFYMFI